MNDDTPEPGLRRFTDRGLFRREHRFGGVARAWILLTRLLAVATLCLVPFSCCFWPFFLGLAVCFAWVSSIPLALEGQPRGFWLEVLPVLAVGLPVWALGVATIVDPPPELSDLPWLAHSPVGIELAGGVAVIGTWLLVLIAVRMRYRAAWRAANSETDAEAAAGAADRLERGSSD